MTEENKEFKDGMAEAASARDGGENAAERSETGGDADKAQGQPTESKSESGKSDAGKPEAGKPDGGDSASMGLIERVARLETENAELRDKLLRAMAEMENLRRRTEREKADIAKYAINKFAGDVVGVADNIRRAIEATPKDAVNADPALKSLAEGVEVTERELMNTLDRHGIKRIDPLHEKFDPNFHQAMFEEESRDVSPGNVVRVMQAGFMIEDRLLRPALVSVAKAWTGPIPEPKPAVVEEAPAKPERPVEKAAAAVDPAAAAAAAPAPEPKSQGFGPARPEWTAPRPARPNPSRHTVTELRKPVEGQTRPRVAVEPAPFASSQRPQPAPSNGGAPVTQRTSTLHQPVISQRPGPRKGGGQ